eukprot:gnl/TRDRNA2_/TRDRNA2_162262_c1_seq2.p1 gnl/TRDRNA2_/TRDRNA2_162262_c1~~gnl/TRDRNA2_/TRDRNA2_162262_c1_seq2.p1  ORF type:complete len:475 (+),score=144.57 gnl/TRDRNA2_/TRDRNA2_162262_c1_seq2:182-1426(+)
MGRFEGTATMRTAGELSLNLAGRTFTSRDEVIGHIRSIQEKVSDGMLSMEDSLFLFHLSMNHPHFVEKVQVPLTGIRYGDCPGFKGTKSFVSVHADGSEQGISWRKSLDVLCPQNTSSAGNKRSREEEPAAENEKIPGVVLEVFGVPEGTEYTAVRDALVGFGNIVWCEVLACPPGIKAKKEEERATEKEEKSEASGPAPDFIPLGGGSSLPAKARIRFEDPAAAAKAAAEFKKFGECDVQASILTGEAEDAYWRRLFKQKWRKEDKGKGKGKDKGKDKGKGKGKGNGEWRERDWYDDNGDSGSWRDNDDSWWSNDGWGDDGWGRGGDNDAGWGGRRGGRNRGGGKGGRGGYDDWGHDDRSGAAPSKKRAADAMTTEFSLTEEEKAKRARRADRFRTGGAAERNTAKSENATGS